MDTRELTATEKSKCLSQAQVDVLGPGVLVWVKWEGEHGYGPDLYQVAWHNSHSCAATAVGTKKPLCKVQPLCPVGAEAHHVKVWLA